MWDAFAEAILALAVFGGASALLGAHRRRAPKKAEHMKKKNFAPSPLISTDKSRKAQLDNKAGSSVQPPPALAPVRRSPQ